MTTIIMADVAMTSPGDAPYMPDISRGIWLDFDFASVSGVADGARITSFAGGGAAPAADRTLQYVYGNSPGGKPFWDADGGPAGAGCLYFDGTCKINNFIAATGSDTTIAQPITWMMRVQILDFDTANARPHERIIGGRSGYQQIITTNLCAPGDISVNAGALTTISGAAPVATGQWVTLGVTFAGSVGKFLRHDGVVVSAAAGSQAYDGLYIGGGEYATAGGGAKFRMDRLRMWSRALSEGEMLMQRSAWTP